MERRVIASTSAPQAMGPYSQGIRAGASGAFIFCAGKIPLDLATGKIVQGDIPIQTRRVSDNLSAVLTVACSYLIRIVKMTVFLANLDAFRAMIETYAEFFPGAPRAVPPGAAGIAILGLASRRWQSSPPLESTPDSLPGPGTGYTAALPGDFPCWIPRNPPPTSVPALPLAHG